MNAMQQMAAVMLAPPPAAPRSPQATAQVAGFDTLTQQLLQLLARNGSMATAELGAAVGLHTRLIWGLLKNARNAGQVVFDGQLWSLSHASVPAAVAQAARVLRAAGWRVEPPAAKAAAEPAASRINASFVRGVPDGTGGERKVYTTVNDATIPLPRSAMATAEFIAHVRLLVPHNEGWRLMAYSLLPQSKGGAL